MTKTARDPVERLAANHKEAADLLRISERKLSDLVEQGKVRRAKAGNKNLFPISELERFLEENLV